MFVKASLPLIDVCAYGAKGDGMLDDTAAVQRAFDAVRSERSGGTVFFPPGRYRVTRPIACADRHLCVMGSGRGVTEIDFVNDSGGFRFTFSDPTSRLTMQAMSIRTNGVNAGIAIQASWPPPGHDDRHAASPHFVDLDIGGTHPHAHWIKGLELTNAAGATIERFDIRGKPGVAAMTHGVELLGRSSRSVIQAGSIADADIAIRVGDRSEDVSISHVDALYTNVSFQIDSAGRGSSISGCRGTSSRFGIFVSHHCSLALTGNVLLQCGGDTFTGIYLGSAKRSRVIANEVGSLTLTGTRNGILLDGGTHDCAIEGNVVSDMNHIGIWMVGLTPPWQPGDDRNVIVGNRLTNCTHGVIDSGAGNLVANNL